MPQIRFVSAFIGFLEVSCNGNRMQCLYIWITEARDKVLFARRCKILLFRGVVGILRWCRPGFENIVTLREKREFHTKI